uniref:Assimilatory nitrate reductase electron transfer subunit n=1 Tax=Streptomyces sp. UC 11065 TaxID=428401 RepID=A3R4T6_9ACTN|nr:assimilatory nitrate reductase electron transfer subunit [Streptomyces sp. UC 11065]
MRARRVVIVGNGMAGHRVAQALVARGDGSRITLVGEEPRPAYNRVLLSSVLAGQADADALELPDPGVRACLGVRATALDTAARRVGLSDGTDLPYDALVLATGARPLIPPVPGLSLPDGSPAPGVATFRTLEDCAGIARLASSGPMAVLGGGLLGVEAARGLAGLGVDVTLVHPFGHPMESQLDAEAGAVLAGVLRGLGVRLLLGQGAAEWKPGAPATSEGPGDPGRLTLTDGSTVRCSGVVVTAGVAPAVDLARAAGLAVRRGIVVDDRLAASAPGVYAVGECAEHRGVCHGLVGPCWEQADALAAVLTGSGGGYTGSRPVIRLKARDIDLAVMGRVPREPDDGTEVVRVSDPARGRYGALALRADRVVGAVLLGLSEATGPVTHLHDDRSPAPADRFSLLLGRTGGAVTGSPAALPNRALVCRCNGVTKSRLVEAWRSGARDPAALARTTWATTGCGGCADTVTEVCAWLERESA